MFKYLIPRGSEIFKKWTCLYHNLSDLTLQNIFDTWWASMNVGSKQPIDWKNSRHAHWWRFYLHCGIEDIGSPGIKCIICHQVFRHPSELVLATVPNSGVDSWSRSDPEPNRWNGSYHKTTQTTAIGPVVPPKTRYFYITCWAPIMYLGSDHIMPQ